MRKIDLLFAEYGESHQNSLNKAIHWICVPLIFWSIVAFIFYIPNDMLHGVLGNGFIGNWAFVAFLLLAIYYLRLSIVLMLAMAMFSLVCIYVSYIISISVSFEVWKIAFIVFALAWVGQFYGHKVEGKKPSFFKDLQFLLIGPAWLMHFLFKKIGIRY